MVDTQAVGPFINCIGKRDAHLVICIDQLATRWVDMRHMPVVKDRPYSSVDPNLQVSMPAKDISPAKNREIITERHCRNDLTYHLVPNAQCRRICRLTRIGNQWCKQHCCLRKP